MTDSSSILLVEDNLDDVFFMKRAFRTADILNPVVVVNDGAAAIDYLAGLGEYSDRSQNPLPCLVLLDLKLPRKSGHEVLAWIREQPHLKSLIVLILTTSRENSDIDLAYKLGCNAFLVKPGSPSQLAALMVSIKSFWGTFNIQPR